MLARVPDPMHRQRRQPIPRQPHLRQLQLASLRQCHLTASRPTPMCGKYALPYVMPL